MSRVIHFDKGSKRRLRQVRWSPFEKTTAVLLFLILTVLCIAAALWDSNYPSLSVQHHLRHQP